jgi:hypothetical protein
MIVALIFCIRAAWAAGTDEDIATEVRTGLKKLDSNNDHNAALRVDLAKLAVNAATAKTAKDPAGAQDCWEAAREALTAALRLDPANKDATTLMATVQKHITPATKPATNPATTPPATKPGADTQPAGPVPFTAKRPVSAAEINRIKQIEWRHDENPAPRGIRVEPETRKKFLAASPDIMPGEFNALKPDAQAAAILDSGKPEFYAGVHITGDPASIREFKMNVEKVVEQNCATCHSGPKAGKFKLFADKNADTDAYSNFLILQRYSAPVNGAVRMMVDRTTPESSLLLQFMLPPDISDAPHPTTPNFKPPAKVKTDPKYGLILKWLKSLDPLAPNYGIDLSADAPAPAPAAPKK